MVVVEDDAPLRALVVEALEEIGCAAEAHADARSLLGRFQRDGAPDLLVTDVRLPGIDGLEALEAIRRSGFDTPAFVMTAFPSDDVRARMRRLHVAWVFEKPFDPDELVQVVRCLFNPPVKEPTR